MSYKPLPEYLTIKRSKIDGLGLFASQDIPAGRVVGITHIYYAQTWIRTPLGGFINHADEPNCVCDGEKVFKLRILKDIAKGEELTLDYGDKKINSFTP